MWTYKDIAAELNTTVEGLHTLVSKGISPLEAAGTEGRTKMFSNENVEEFIGWWNENEVYRSLPTAPPGEAFDEKGMLVYLGIPATTRQYYRRRYGRLYPDYYLRGERSGRPRAMYLRESLDKFKVWIAAGKPELRITSLSLDGPFGIFARFEDGVTVAIKGGKCTISPQNVLGREQEEQYIRLVREKARRKLRTKRRKNLTEA